MEERTFASSLSRWLRIGLALLAVILLVVFVAVNSQNVQVDFVVFEQDMRLAFALLLSALLGFLVGWIISRLKA